RPSLKIIDPICTLMFSVIVLVTTVPIMCDIVRVLSEACPKHIDYDSLVGELSSVPGVSKVEELRVWCLGTSSYALNAILVVDVFESENKGYFKVVSFKKLMSECKNKLKGVCDNFEHVNFQVEFNEVNDDKN